MSTNKEVVLTYTTTLRSHLSDNIEMEKAQRALNKAWGYEDGHCNEEVTLPNGHRKIVSKQPEPEEFVDAHYALHRTSLVKVEVSIHKDGTSSFKILE